MLAFQKNAFQADAFQETLASRWGYSWLNSWGSSWDRAAAVEQVDGGVRFRPSPQWQPAAWRPILEQRDVISSGRIGLCGRSIITWKRADGIETMVGALAMLSVLEEISRFDVLDRVDRSNEATQFHEGRGVRRRAGTSTKADQTR